MTLKRFKDNLNKFMISKHNLICFWGEKNNYGFLSNFKISYMKAEKTPYDYFIQNNESLLNEELKSIYNRTNFCCVEQYLMACKAALFNDKEIFIKIMNANFPVEIKKLGRKVSNFIEFIWDEYKEDIMYNGIKAKFDCNNEYKKFLIENKNKYFIEASPYDKIWGIGMDEKTLLSKNKNYEYINITTDFEGKNLLGKTIMKYIDINIKKLQI